MILVPHMFTPLHLWLKLMSIHWIVYECLFCSLPLKCHNKQIVNDVWCSTPFFPSLKPYQRELLISDTFEFLTSETQTKAKVIVELPIYDYPDPFEDIYMKTNINPAINPNLKQHNIKRSEYKHSCNQPHSKYIFGQNIIVVQKDNRS
jgi:hypothetical protein